MRTLALAFFLSSTFIAAHASDVKTDVLCEPLRTFVNAVQPDETRRLTFYTSWGRNFKDDASPALMAKRCNHEGYEPAKAVCVSLIENGSTEFADYNLKRALTCLSPEMNIMPLSFRHALIRMHYGTNDRGSLVEFELAEKTEIGGAALTILVNGY